MTALSEGPGFKEGEEAISAVVPITTTSQPPPLLELEAVFEPLGLEVLGRSLEARLDEMLARLNAHDYLGTLVLAESILLAVSGHGLAVVCRNEALGALAPMLDNPVTRGSIAETDEPLPADAMQLLQRCDGRTKAAMMLPSGLARVRMLRALHDLVRTGLVHIGQPVTVLERANTLPAPSSK